MGLIVPLPFQWNTVGMIWLVVISRESVFFHCIRRRLASSGNAPICKPLTV
jgi:hypothetical protein